ncbi:cobalamin-binding protein [Paraglaciecola aestuariivivens]
MGLFTASAGSWAEDSIQNKQQRRIIALAPHLVESLFAIGAGQQIIATTAHADYPSAAKQIPVVGNYARLQIEKILQLQPDLIIAWKTGNPIDDLARLEQYQLNVVYTHPQTLADVAEELLLLGEVTGRSQTAQALAEQYLHRLNQLKHSYAQQAKVSVFYELWSRPIRTVANQAWPQQQLALCGAQNPFAHAQDDYPSVGLEQVLASLPQVVIQPSQSTSGDPDRLNWQQWPHIPAAKHGFIFHPNADKVHRMSPRMLDEVEKMCAQIHLARLFYLNQLTR